MNTLKEGDKVVSPDGIPGIVVEAETRFGEYEVQLDTGQRIWFYAEELTLEAPRTAQDGRKGDKAGDT